MGSSNPSALHFLRYSFSASSVMRCSTAGAMLCACRDEGILEAFVVFNIFFDCVGVGCADGYSVPPLPLAVSGVFIVGER